MIAEKKKITLGDLLPQVLKTTSEDWATRQISGLAYDSRKVQPGDLFISVPGRTTDGHHYLQQVAAAGAVAAVVEHITEEDILQIKVENSRRMIAELAHRFYDYPAQKMKIFGVTGTNGKTTIVAAIEAMAKATGRGLGIIGTIAHRIGERTIPAGNTTPEALDCDRMFTEMLAAGISECVMEVSSHGLELDRVYGVPFSGAVFSNLTRDHLDFHQDLESYCKAKLRLFRENLQPQGFAIINTDDPLGEKFAAAASGSTVWRYSLSDKTADIRWKTLDESLNGSTAAIFTPVGLLNLSTPLWGTFNFANLAAAIGVAIALGYPPQAITAGLTDFRGVCGRAQPLDGDFDFSVFIDFAHTPDALRNVLSAVRPLVSGQLRVLFGCGGERDSGKRPLMAQAAEQFADQIYLTSDNPRSEDPLKIIADVMAGFDNPDAVIVQPDRTRAIERIIHDCSSTDSAFLCGKGHETVQLIGEDKIEFDDGEVAAKFLTARGFTLATTAPLSDR